jgi:hypothetical protein
VFLVTRIITMLDWMWAGALVVPGVGVLFQ